MSVNGMKAPRDALAAIVKADALLAPDSQLVAGGYLILDADGNPLELDVRPLLRALGRWALDQPSQRAPMDRWIRRAIARDCLIRQGLTGPLADACLAAVEDGRG